MYDQILITTLLWSRKDKQNLLMASNLVIKHNDVLATNIAGVLLKSSTKTLINYSGEISLFSWTHTHTADYLLQEMRQ